MRKVKIFDSIDHIEPEEIFNSDLKEVITSWKAKSETRYVTSIDIKHNGDTITLVDTPGSEETQSAEIEFANILGVKKAIGLA